VLVPDVDPRIEEGNEHLGVRVAGVLGFALSDIARPAGQCEVVYIVRSTETRRDHVVDLELEVENDLWRAAVFAPASCTTGDDFVQPMWHVRLAREFRVCGLFER